MNSNELSYYEGGECIYHISEELGRKWARFRVLLNLLIDYVHLNAAYRIKSQIEARQRLETRTNTLRLKCAGHVESVTKPQGGQFYRYLEART